MREKIAGLILAGGLSSRLGGGDKCLLELAGKPLLRHVIDRICSQVGTLALNANGDPARFAAFGLPVLPDTVAGYPGPLAGVLAGLEWIKAQAPLGRLATVAGDTPFFPHDLIRQMAAAAGKTPEAVVIAGAAGREHPTFALWPADTAAPLRAYLHAGGRKALDFIHAHPFIRVDFPASGGRDPFFNINTPQDMAEAERMMEDENR